MNKSNNYRLQSYRLEAGCNHTESARKSFISFETVSSTFSVQIKQPELPDERTDPAIRTFRESRLTKAKLQKR